MQCEPQVLAQLLPAAAEAPAGNCKKTEGCRVLNKSENYWSCRVMNITKDLWRCRGSTKLIDGSCRWLEVDDGNHAGNRRQANVLVLVCSCTKAAKHTGDTEEFEESLREQELAKKA